MASQETAMARLKMYSRSQWFSLKAPLLLSCYVIEYRHLLLKETLTDLTKADASPNGPAAAKKGVQAHSSRMASLGANANPQDWHTSS